MRLFSHVAKPRSGGVHTACMHPAQLKSSSEPPKEIAARRVAPADLAVQLELVVVHLRHEGGVFL